MTDVRSHGPADVQFLFPNSQQRVSGALGVSCAIHGVAIALAIFVATRPYVRSAATLLLPQSLNKDIVWFSQAGPGGGGGGGGNRAQEAPRKAQLRGNDTTSMPVVKVPSPSATYDDQQPLLQSLVIPAQTIASNNLALAGVLDGPPGVVDSQGPGSNGGAGRGNGPGMGPGNGDGLGPGRDAGFGNGPYSVGSGVTKPRVLKEVKPQYTAQAMRGKIQGSVLLECVVLPDGTAGNMRVVRSLDSTFGLDQEAMKAARQWQFAPGTRFGQPVPVLVTIEIAFTLR
jgi:periplasmic protein TonB